MSPMSICFRNIQIRIMKQILLVSATRFEIQPTLDFLKQYQEKNIHVTVLITGVGMLNTGFCLGQHLAKNQYDLAIQAGIAGSFRREVPLGAVVQVVSEQYGDFGVEEADGSFTDMQTMGFIETNYLKNDYEIKNVPVAKGLTVQKVHGFQPNIDKIIIKYNPDIETMEGIAFFQACLHHSLDFLALRGISNYVESRNRAAWNIPLAIQNVNNLVIHHCKHRCT
ncbi:MAG: futalosine hydrolase [Bacteroidota bacterium]|jgi:futalosine hydrolase